MPEAPCFARQQRARQRQGIAGHEAIRQQQEESADEGFADTHRGAADENDVSQGPQEEHLQQRQNGHQDLHDDQDGQRILEFVGGPAKPGADSHQEQPVAQHQAEHQFVSAKRGEQFAHQRQLRHHARNAQRPDGQQDEPPLTCDRQQDRLPVGHETLLRLLEGLDVIDGDADIPAAPVVRRAAGFLREVVEEFDLVRKLLPDLRQKRRHAGADSEHHAILARLQLVQEVLRRIETQRLRFRQHADFNFDFVYLIRPHRLETRVAGGRVPRVVHHRLAKRFLRQNVADAAA